MFNSKNTLIFVKQIFKIMAKSNTTVIDLNAKLIDSVISRVKKDIEAGDVTAIEELLTFSPIKNLIQFLPENEQETFKILLEN